MKTITIAAILLFSALSVAQQHFARIDMNQSTGTGITGNNFYRGASVSGPFTKVASFDSPSTTYTDTSVVAGATYWYVATAVSLDGESSFSVPVVATIPSDTPPPPPPLTYPLNMVCDTLVAAKGGKGVPNLSVSQVVLTNCRPN